MRAVLTCRKLVIGAAVLGFFSWPFLPCGAGQFIRGNVNQDAAVDQSDAIHILGHLFLGEIRPGCLDAADIDDSGILDVTDSIHLLVFFFAGGPPPNFPYPGCGPDAGEESLGCLSFPACDGPPVALVVGRTVSRDGAPLAGAKVSAGPESTLSGPDGHFELGNIRLASTIQVTATLGLLAGDKQIAPEWSGGRIEIAIGDIVLTEPRPVPDRCGNVVARAVERGCGRVFAWGDEHVRYDEYLPASGSFWRNAIDWLAENTCTGDRRGRIVTANFSFEPGLRGMLEGMGLSVNDIHSVNLLEATDILVVQAYSGWVLEPDALEDWIEGGAALMTMVPGLGDRHPAECDEANRWTSIFGIEYDCSRGAPWGPVTDLEDHPIAIGLAAGDIPFVNGRLVAGLSGYESEVVARAGPCSPPPVADCRRPAALNDGTPAAGEVVVETDCAQTALISDTDEATPGPELHIIGIYESRSREVTVRVNRPGRMVLALTAYGGDCNGMSGEHRWTVIPGPGAVIERVLVSGLALPAASVPEGTEVEVYSGESWLGYSYGDDCGGGNAQELLLNVERAAGLRTRSFHGCYEASEFTFIK